MTSTNSLSTTTPTELRNWIDAGSAVLIDVREASEFTGESIVGSVSHPLSQLDASHLAESGFGRIVLTCASGARARKAGRILLEAGFKEVSYVDGGLDALKRAAFTVNVNKNAPISIMRQVQMIVGGLSLTGALLGYAFHPGFYAIGAIVGLGLLFAGLSGTCMMASVLARLPYNQIPNQQT